MPTPLKLEAEVRPATRGLWGLAGEISSGSPAEMMGFLLYGCRCSKKR
jgi:hypothetical protein